MVLTDGNGNVYILNGQALVTDATVSVSFTKNSTISSYSVDGTSYTSNQTLTLSTGEHTLICVGSNHIYINDERTYKQSGSTISFTVNETNTIFTGDDTTITCSVSNPIELRSVNEPV